MKTVKRLLLLFIVALFISGLTAIPIDTQLNFLLKRLSANTSLYVWIDKVSMPIAKSMKNTNSFYMVMIGLPLRILL